MMLKGKQFYIIKDLQYSKTVLRKYGRGAVFYIIKDLQYSKTYKYFTYNQSNCQHYK